MAEPARRVVPSGRTPIRHVKASEYIIDELRRMAVRGGKAGDYLPSERALVDKFGVSRPTIREAIRVLESEGLIAIRRGVRGGAVIREPSVDDLTRRFGVFLQTKSATGAEVFAVRGIVEPRAAALAAADPGRAREPLELALRREADQLHNMDSDHSVSVNIVSFHDTILELSGNRVLAGVSKLLTVLMAQHAYEELTAFRKAGPEERRGALERSHAAHKRISDAIISGDSSRAEKLMTDHLVALSALSPEAACRSIDILGPSLEDSAATRQPFGSGDSRCG